MAIQYIQVEQLRQTLALPSVFLPYKPPFRLLQSKSLERAVTLAFGLFCLSYTASLFAFTQSEGVAELKVLTEETAKIVKNGCYIAGSASALVGAIWAVASQSLKVAASSAAVTIVALKAASFFATTLLI